MKRYLIIVLVSLFTWTQTVTADDTHRLSIAVGDWPPYFDQQAPDQGIAARLLRDVFAAEGFEVTYHFLPWKRAYYEAALGKHDATAVWMHAPEREQDFDFSNPVLMERFVIFHLQDQPITWSRVEDLSELKLGGSIGYSYGPAFDRAVANNELDVEWVSSTLLNFRRLLFNRIDAFPEEINVGHHILRRELPESDASRITYHPESLLENESFVMFPKALPDSEKLMARFNQRLQAFRDSGQYDRYFETFSVSSVHSRQPAEKSDAK